MVDQAAIQPGDLVLALVETGAPARAPAGKIESVLMANSGGRMLIERAFFPGRYVVAPVADVSATEYDAAADLRWHHLRTELAEVIRRGVFRRELGRLTPDLLPSSAPPTPDDAAAMTSLRQAIDGDPLTGDGEITLRVARGVAVLDGWVRVVGAKLMAERLARTTSGIWEARNRLVSDEELRARVGDHVRSASSLATCVTGIEAMLGRLTLVVRAQPEGTAAADAQRLRALVPGLREISLHERASRT